MSTQAVPRTGSLLAMGFTRGAAATASGLQEAQLPSGSEDAAQP